MDAIAFARAFINIQFDFFCGGRLVSEPHYRAFGTETNLGTTASGGKQPGSARFGLEVANLADLGPPLPRADICWSPKLLEAIDRSLE